MSNIGLAARYVGAGALLGVGINTLNRGIDKFDDPGNKAVNIGAGIAATGAGLGVMMMGNGKLQALPFANGNSAVLKSVGMLGAFVGAAALVGIGMNSIDD